MNLREHIAELERERISLQLALDNNTRMLRDLRHQLAVEPTTEPSTTYSETMPGLRGNHASLC